MISRFNGSDLSIELDDVVDHRHPSQESACEQVVSTTAVGNAIKAVEDVHCSSPIPIVQSTTEVDETSPLGTPPDEEDVVPFGSGLVADYHAIGETVAPDSQRPYPSEGQTEDLKEGSNVAEEESEDAPLNPVAILPRKGRRSRSTFSTSSRALTEQKGRKARLRGVFPRWLADPLDAWTDRVVMVLSPEWLKTTLLVWSAWFGMSLGASLVRSTRRSGLTHFSAFTMFNVFLPKLLESTPSRSAIIRPKSLEESLWDVVVFTIGGCPGAIVRRLLHVLSRY